jgi:PAS domain S-box-containing protein
VTTTAAPTESSIALSSLQAIEDRLRRQRDALVKLTAEQLTDCDALASALSSLLEVSAGALSVSRASIWRYNDDRSAITCIDLFDSITKRHGAGTVLEPADFPNYFQAIRDSDVVAADDARHDPRTREFTDTYLRPLNIYSMVDAPLHGNGQVIGVLCFEHVAARRWTTDEKTFAIAIANLVSLALERCEHAKTQSTLAVQAAALNAVTHAMVITDCDRRIVWANPAFSELTGYGIDELIGQDPVKLVGPLAGGDVLVDAVLEQVRLGHSWHGETVTRRKDGSTFAAEQSITAVRGGDGQVTHFVSLRIDLTQRRALEAQFLQAQKMEVVGRLAGGVAHDFNNMLTVINGMAEFALEDLAPGHPLRDDLQHIFDSGKRAASLTRQLLTFSRKQIVTRHTLDAGTALRDFRSMLQRLIGEDVRLDVTTGADDGYILADQSQFEQVILNLAVNAKDAMPSGGSLRIDVTTRDVSEPPRGAVMPMAPGRYVALTVSDTGCGMPPDVVTRVFEPFFTTKENGKGTGLGMATVYAIVEQSGGSIVVTSEVNVGTTFTIYLPQVGVDSEVATTARPAETRKGIETVLLVEDDVAVRTFGQRCLERCGYRVLSASNAATAAKIAEDFAEPIALLVTDVVMPGVSGRELAGIVTARRPETRVLFTSGYTDDTVLAHGVRQNTMQFLAKPYSSQALAHKVREILDAPPSVARHGFA